jgi:heme/copper-type cytochrome/quinol oxidase subunit 3
MLPTTLNASAAPRLASSTISTKSGILHHGVCMSCMACAVGTTVVLGAALGERKTFKHNSNANITLHPPLSSPGTNNQYEVWHSALCLACACHAWHVLWVLLLCLVLPWRTATHFKHNSTAHSIVHLQPLGSLQSPFSTCSITVRDVLCACHV